MGDHVYKVVYKNGGTWISAMGLAPLDVGLTLTYRLETVTTPRAGLIFAFRNLSDAERFKTRAFADQSLVSIFECEYGARARSVANVLCGATITVGRAERFWAAWEEGAEKGVDFTCPAPQGTVGVDWVRPVKAIISTP